jgi:exosortase
MATRDSQSPLTGWSLPRFLGGAPLPFWAPPVAGFVAMAIPSLLSMARLSWSTEAGTHQPIVLATGAWLLHYNGLRLHDARREAGSSRTTFGLLALCWVVYAFGRAYGFLVLEGTALFGVFVALIYQFFGIEELRRQAFPLFYLAFAIPIPGSVLGLVTQPLQVLVSWASTGIVGAAGYPIARQGVTISIAQFQLLVEDACAGLNSLIGLVAISLFYIYVVHRGSWRYSLLLTAFVIPIAIFVNILRVSAIILIVYYFGDEVGEGVMHGTTGMVLFTLALAMVFLLDWVLSRRFRVGQHA